MSVTIQQLVQDALGILGEVTGVGTQLYSEPRMVKDAGRAFNMLFKKHWWKQYSPWQTVTLDGTTGTFMTSPFTQVLDFDDFLAVHRDKQSKGLPTLPEDMNPVGATGTTALFWTSLPVTDPNYAGKKLQIYPITATGIMNIRARVHPLPVGTDWQQSTTVYLDRDLLAFGTAFVALSGDDLNPQAKQDVQAMMDSKYRDIMNSLANQKTAFAERTSVPNNWFVNPH
jgi:hypothetical protein